MPAESYRRQGAEWRIILVADDEFDYAETWLYETLTGSTTLMALLPGGVVQGNTAPEGIRYPFCSFSFVTAEPDAAHQIDVFGDAGMIHGVLRYLITVWGEGRSYEPLSEPNKLIKVLLHDVEPTPDANGHIVSCRRYAPWREDTSEG